MKNAFRETQAVQMPLVTSFPRKLLELGRDWVGIGSGLGRDGSGLVGIGSGLGRDWVGMGFWGHDSQSCAFSNFWPSFALFRPIFEEKQTNRHVVPTFCEICSKFMCLLAAWLNSL